MLILKNCRFLSTPKTGSQWAHRALLESVSGAVKFGDGDEKYHAGLNDERTELPAIAFVRHPLQWYPSYWNHRMRCGWSVTHGIDIQCGSPDFETFMTAVVEELPGWLNGYLSNWIGTAEEPAAFIGRHENLQADLMTGLHVFDEEFDEEKLLATAATNTSDYVTWPAVWTDSLIEAVCDSEQELIQRFYE